MRNMNDLFNQYKGQIPYGADEHSARKDQMFNAIVAQKPAMQARRAKQRKLKRTFVPLSSALVAAAAIFAFVFIVPAGVDKSSIIANADKYYKEAIEEDGYIHYTKEDWKTIIRIDDQEASHSRITEQWIDERNDNSRTEEYTPEGEFVGGNAIIDKKVYNCAECNYDDWFEGQAGKLADAWEVRLEEGKDSQEMSDMNYDEEHEQLINELFSLQQSSDADSRREVLEKLKDNEIVKYAGDVDFDLYRTHLLEINLAYDTSGINMETNFRTYIQEDSYRFVGMETEWVVGDASMTTRITVLDESFSYDEDRVHADGLVLNMDLWWDHACMATFGECDDKGACWGGGDYMCTLEGVNIYGILKNEDEDPTYRTCLADNCENNGTDAFCSIEQISMCKEIVEPPELKDTMSEEQQESKEFQNADSIGSVGLTAPGDPGFNEDYDRCIRETCECDGNICTCIGDVPGECLAAHW